MTAAGSRVSGIGHPSTSHRPPRPSTRAYAPALPPMVSRWRRTFVLVLAMSVPLVLGCNATTVAPSDTPPQGTIWFGRAFDPQTFSLTGKDIVFTAGQPVALVATLNRESRDEALAINLANSAGTFVAGGGQMKAGNTLMAYLIPAVFVLAGNYEVSITDAGGNVLSTGHIAVQ